MNARLPVEPRPPAAEGALALALRREVAERLGAAAGRHGFSTRRRPYEMAQSERARRRAMRRTAAVGFALLVALPLALAGLYYGLLAEDQYEVETRMILRVNEAARPDGVEAATGLPSLEMKRDTQVVAAYLDSAALVAVLAEAHGLRGRLEGPAVHALKPETWLAGDWPARPAPNATAEELLADWEGRTDVEIELPAGIIVFALRAFRPEDAEALAAASIAAAEELVRGMNARVWADAVAKAETLFAEAADRLAAAQAELAVARNALGVLDAEREAGALSSLQGSIRQDLIDLRRDRAAQAKHLAPGSARLRALDGRIAALEGELAGLSAGRVGAGAPLAEVMARFSRIEVDQDLAERQFLAAARKLEGVRHAAEAGMIYLDVFVPPTRPEEARHPKRAQSVAVVAVLSLLAWGAALGGVALLRNHMA